MKRSTVFWAACLLLGATLPGCGKKDDVKVIVCDTDHAVAFDPSASGVFTQLVLERAPLVVKNHVEIPGDGSLYLSDNVRPYRYSLADGRQEMAYGQRGRAKNEYVKIWDYWLDGADLCLYDIDGGKVLRYAPDGTVLAVKEILGGSVGFQQLCRLDPEHWVGKSNYHGVPGETPELTLFDNELQDLQPIGEEKLRSGMVTGYHFCAGAEGVFYCGPLSDRIWRVAGTERHLQYRVRFSDGALNPENYPDEYQQLADISAKLESQSFSFNITGLSVSGPYLGFSYSSSRKGSMYALYDTEKAGTYCFDIDLPESWQLVSGKLSGDRIYFVAFSDEGGVSVWSARTADLIALGA